MNARSIIRDPIMANPQPIAAHESDEKTASDTSRNALTPVLGFELAKNNRGLRRKQACYEGNAATDEVAVHENCNQHQLRLKHKKSNGVFDIENLNTSLIFDFGNRGNEVEIKLCERG